MDLSLLIRLPVFAIGVVVVFTSIRSAIRTFLLPRAAPDLVTEAVFGVLWRTFNIWSRRLPTYEERDKVMAYYAPIGILVLLVAWLSLVLIGYTLMYWAIDARVWDFDPWLAAFTLSGSSLFTLGYAPVSTLPEKILTFSEAAMAPSSLRC
jgi:hypothetical protein